MNPIGLYLHIPFCDGKCAYCNFFSRCANENLLSEYTDCLIESIRNWGKKLNRTIDTVYFGGGTPSLLGHERLITILSCIKESFQLSKNPEITVEVNPSSTDVIDFTALHQAGFNRLSIGLQSADDNELHVLSRRHSLADAQRTVMRAQNAGFNNISLDVMLAIPHQKKISLDRTLDFCASCGVQHISAYILKVEEGTPFFKMKGELPLFSDDEQAELYEYTVDKLAALGYQQYEVSNFACPGYESKHNLHYWHDEEYLGLGPSAHSYLDNQRFYYENDLQSFYDDKICYESSGGDRDEYIMLSLRLNEGLNLTEYEKRYHHPVSENILKAAHRLQERELCRVTEKAIALTVKGFLVSNAIIAYLLENS